MIQRLARVVDDLQASVGARRGVGEDGVEVEEGNLGGTARSCEDSAWRGYSECVGE
jgi:hypothetical protein